MNLLRIANSLRDKAKELDSIRRELAEIEGSNEVLLARVLDCAEAVVAGWDVGETPSESKLEKLRSAVHDLWIARQSQVNQHGAQLDDLDKRGSISGDSGDSTNEPAASGSSASV